MTLTVYRELEQRTDEWFAARCGIVTASAVGRLITPTLKVASNDTSRGVQNGLIAERITGHVEESPMNSDMFRGVQMEPVAREAYEQHAGVTVDEVGFMVRDLGDGVRLGYSPDGLVGDDGLIEIKCPRQKGHMMTVESKSVPAIYMGQLQAGLLVSGREWIDFVSYCTDMVLFVKRVEPDQRWFDTITEAVRSYEQAASDMQARYAAAAAGLPVMERPAILEEIVV